MRKKIILLSLSTIPLLLNAETILESIEVNGQEEQQEATLNSDSAFAGDVVYEKEGYLHHAPMQKQMSGKRAIEVAGSNGDPLKALQSFAGIVSTNNDNGSEIYIHGSKPRETLFTLNHLPVGYLFHLGGIHSVIAPELTGQIDAYLGGFDVTYGAMGAVVDISPKYPIGEDAGHLHIGMYDADFAYDAKLGENTNLFISGRRSYFDLIADKVMDELDSDKEDKRKKTTFTLFPQFNDGTLILTHEMGDELFSLEMITAHDKLKLNDTFNIEKDPVAVGKINSDYSFNTIGTRWVHNGENSTSNTLLYRLSSEENSEFFDADYFVKTNSKEYGLYHETVFDLEKHTLSVGAEVTKTHAPVSIHANRPDDTDVNTPVTQQEVVDLEKTFDAKEYTLFAQDIWELSPSDYFRYGLRGWKTDFQNFGSGVDPRVAYVHEVNDNLTLSMAVGKYSQLPQNLSMIKEFGNPKIDTQESSTHYTLSMQKRFDDHSSVTVEPYFKTFKNLAISDDQTNYQAVGEGESYGLDVTYKKKIDKFDMMVAYTYVKAKRQLNTNSQKQYRFEGDIPHTLQVSTNYHFGNNWHTSAYLKYSSGSPYTPIVGRENYDYKGKSYVRPIYGTPYSKRLEANYDFDMQVGKTFKYADNKSLEVSLEFMNINALFKKNVEGIKYDDQYEENGTYEQMGFLPAFHVTYQF